MYLLPHLIFLELRHIDQAASREETAINTTP